MFTRRLEVTKANRIHGARPRAVDGGVLIRASIISPVCTHIQAFRRKSNVQTTRYRASTHSVADTSVGLRAGNRTRQRHSRSHTHGRHGAFTDLKDDAHADGRLRSASNWFTQS